MALASEAFLAGLVFKLRVQKIDKRVDYDGLSVGFLALQQLVFMENFICSVLIWAKFSRKT